MLIKGRPIFKLYTLIKSTWLWVFMMNKMIIIQSYRKHLNKMSVHIVILHGLSETLIEDDLYEPIIEDSQSAEINRSYGNNLCERKTNFELCKTQCSNNYERFFKNCLLLSIIMIRVYTFYNPLYSYTYINTKCTEWVMLPVVLLNILKKY